MQQPLPDRIPLPCATPPGTELAGCHQSSPPAALPGRERPARTGEAGPVDLFVARVNALAPHGDVPLATRAWVLTEVRSIAERIDPTGCAGVPTGYARCLIHEDPSGWSLAAIILQPGQATPAHDHGGWGGAVTVRGLERDRRFAPGAAADPILVAERDYPPGTGYLFGPDDVHQPVGADPDGPTVSLHFLAHASHDRPQHRHEHEQTGHPTTEVAAMTEG